jgi:uncharacterized protein
MAKIIAWLVLIFVVLLALRIINQRNARARQKGSGQTAAAGAQPMVRCTRCGVFLPRAEAKAISGGTFACADGQCAKR